MASKNLSARPPSAKEEGDLYLSDAELKELALTLWANRIESGDANLTRRQARAKGRAVPALNPRALAVVGRLRGLALAARAGA